MAIELETARLLIRPFVPGDWEAVHAYPSQQVRAYVPEWPETPEQARTFVRENLDEDARVHALVLRDGGRPVRATATRPRPPVR